MNIRGHPVHVMLIHFPVALWPAHTSLHSFSHQLPAGVAGVAGFWCLVAGTGLGWFAAGCGLVDLLGLQREGDSRRLMDGLWHAMLNGTVLIAFTSILAVEYPSYPTITHGAGFLGLEVLLLTGMGLGNYFGGEIVWRKAGPAP